MLSHPSVSTSPQRAPQTRSASSPASPSRRAHQKISKICRRALPDIQRRHARYVFLPASRWHTPKHCMHSTKVDRYPSTRTSKMWTWRYQRASAIARACYLLCEKLVRTIDRASPSDNGRPRASHRRHVSLYHADLQNPSAHHGTFEQPSSVTCLLQL